MSMSALQKQQTTRAMRMPTVRTRMVVTHVTVSKVSMALEKIAIEVNVPILPVLRTKCVFHQQKPSASVPKTFRRSTDLVLI